MVRRLPIAVFAALALCMPASAHAAGASAKVGVVDCDLGAVPVTLSNDGAPLTFQVLRGTEVIRSMVVAGGGAPTQVLVPIAEASHALVTVRYGSSYVSSSVARRCSGAGDVRTFGSSSTASTDAPFVSSAVAATSSGSAASPSTAARTPVKRSTSAAHPDGGASAWWIASLAALAAMSLAVLGLVVTRRRRTAADEPRRAPAGPPRA
jgi:hypothetical protein